MLEGFESNKNRACVMHSIKMKVKVSIKKSKSDKELEKRLHSFLKAWKEHIHDEISIHRDLMKDGNLHKHLKKTKDIHSRFIKKLTKI